MLFIRSSGSLIAFSLHTTFPTSRPPARRGSSPWTRCAQFNFAAVQSKTLRTLGAITRLQGFQNSRRTWTADWDGARGRDSFEALSDECRHVMTSGVSKISLSLLLACLAVILQESIAGVDKDVNPYMFTGTAESFYTQKFTPDRVL
jgi:hypothetical protein